MKTTRYARNPYYSNQADPRPHRSNRQCYGADSAGRIPLVDLRSTMSLRPAHGRNWDVVRHHTRAVALLSHSHVLCRAFKALSRRGIIVFLRRTGFLIEIEGL